MPTNLRSVPDAPRRGVKYLRQSWLKEETISDAVQRTAADDYGARNNIEWVNVIDPDFPTLTSGEIWEQHTGRVWHKRKGVVRAMRLVEDHEVDVVVLWKWNRLSRKKLHWAVAEDTIEKLGGAIESATEPSDVTTASGRFGRNVMIDMAEFESDRIGEGWGEAHANRRARGLPATGGARFGYIHIREIGEPERYVINLDENPIVEWMYQTYLDGGGGETAIARELNRRGILTTRGHMWSRNTVKGYMDSGFAAGLIVRKELEEDHHPIQRPLSQRVWVGGAHEPIIDRAAWNSYLLARSSRHRPAPRVVNPVHPLAGLLKCECGAGMLRHTARQGRPHYRCGAFRRGLEVPSVNVREDYLYAVLLAELAKIADRVDAAEVPAVGLLAPPSRVNVKLAARQVAELDRQMVELTRQLMAKIVPEVAYMQTRDELMAERAQAAERLAIAEQAARSVPSEPVATVARRLLDDWTTLPVKPKQKLLSQVLREVTVVKGSQDEPCTILFEWTN